MNVVTQRFLCRKCGMVRDSDYVPFCRHFALDLPAARMVPIPANHPCAEGDLEAHLDTADRLTRRGKHEGP